MLFDAAGGGSRLAPIQLCALLQRLAKLAPAPELLTAAERSQLRGFADEVRGWVGWGGGPPAGGGGGGTWSVRKEVEWGSVIP
jgi:hypothetical protein